MKASKRTLILSGCFIITLLGWSFWMAPLLKKLPANFTYNADILSLDNFYDINVKKFEGEQVSKTVFEYKKGAQSKNNYHIENNFTVRKLSGIPIISIHRDYLIDPYNKKQLPTDEEKRFGYLFGPQYANKSPFYYWHVNYNAPAEMHFINEENIEGLKVYHYKAHYQADQTANLTNLPEVPEKRGIRADVNLDLWIEPISGWLVKYEDHTLANYYDRATGKVLFPWNKFSNRYTINSIRDQVKIASYQKWKYLSVDFGIPLFLILLFGIFINYSSVKNKLTYLTIKFQNNLFKIMSTAFILLFIASCYHLLSFQKKTQVYIVGVSQWNNNPDALSIIKGFKAGMAENGFVEGQNINYVEENPQGEIENQIGILQRFLMRRANLVFVLSTPGALIAKGISSNTPIVFSDVNYPLEASLISKLKAPDNNLVGASNYISPARQFYYFEKLYPKTKVLAFLRRKGDPDSEIQLQEFTSMLNKRNIKVIDIAAIDNEHLEHLLEKSPSFDAMYLACGMLTKEGGDDIAVNYSLEKKIPTFSCKKNTVAIGALTGYVADYYLIGKQAGYKSALILKGAKINWLRTDIPGKGLFVINLNTAKQLGIKITDEIINQIDILLGTNKP